MAAFKNSTLSEPCAVNKQAKSYFSVIFTEISMAAARDRRNNAGNRYARLLNEEEDEDDFYKTQYGGFSEEKTDIDYL
jgi:hypothetical protein